MTTDANKKRWNTGRPDSDFRHLSRVGVKAGTEVVLDAKQLLPGVNADDVVWEVDGKRSEGGVFKHTWDTPGESSLVLFDGRHAYTKELHVGIYPEDLREQSDRLRFYYVLVFVLQRRIHILPFTAKGVSLSDYCALVRPTVLEEVEQRYLRHRALAERQSQLYSCSLMKSPFVNPNHVKPGFYAVFREEVVFISGVAGYEDIIAPLLDALTYDYDAAGYLDTRPASTLSAMEDVVGALCAKSIGVGTGMRYPGLQKTVVRGDFKDFLTSVINPLNQYTQDYLVGFFPPDQLPRSGVNTGVMFTYDPQDLQLSSRLSSRKNGLTRHVTNRFGDGSASAVPRSFAEFCERELLQHYEHGYGVARVVPTTPEPGATRWDMFEWSRAVGRRRTHIARSLMMGCNGKEESGLTKAADALGEAYKDLNDYKNYGKNYTNGKLRDGGYVPGKVGATTLEQLKRDVKEAERKVVEEIKKASATTGLKYPADPNGGAEPSSPGLRSAWLKWMEEKGEVTHAMRLGNWTDATIANVDPDFNAYGGEIPPITREEVMEGLILVSEFAASGDQYDMVEIGGIAPDCGPVVKIYTVGGVDAFAIKMQKDMEISALAAHALDPERINDLFGIQGPIGCKTD